MIPSSISQGVTTLQLLASIDAAATANASTVTGLDVTGLEGCLIVTHNVGILDGGSITGTVITSAASDLSDPTTVGSFTAITTSTDLAAQSISVELNKCQQYIGYIGTIVTGGALVGCTAVGKKKTV
jgi:hypothetical protein